LDLAAVPMPSRAIGSHGAWLNGTRGDMPRFYFDARACTLVGASHSTTPGCVASLQQGREDGRDLVSGLGGEQIELLGQ
jgi:hypothetical protein